jgi:general secretion pathway protein G
VKKTALILFLRGVQAITALVTIWLVATLLAEISLASHCRCTTLSVAKADILTLRCQLVAYEVDHGHYPTTRQGLMALIARPPNPPEAERWKGPYLEGPNLRGDPWGHAFRYQWPGRRHPEKFDLWSIGPDGVEGTDDDILGP